MGDKIDKALAVGSTFDWITPLFGLLGEAVGGQVGIAADMRGWNGSARSLLNALGDHGIRTHASQLDFQGDTLVFNVSKRDEDKAIRLLKRWNAW